MIRVEICMDVCFPIVNLLISSLISLFGLVSQKSKLAGKCLMTGHYHKLCKVLYTSLNELDTLEPLLTHLRHPPLLFHLSAASNP